MTAGRHRQRPLLRRFGSKASWSLGAVAMIAALATCGASSTASSVPGSSVPASSVPGSSVPALWDSSPSGPVSSPPDAVTADADQPDSRPAADDLPGSDPPGTLEPGQQIAGTDARVMAPVAPTPAIEAVLVAFGRLHLAYHHDDDRSARIEALRPLVTPELLAVLAQPLPPALVELLAAEQRVVVAEPLGIEPIDAGTYLVSFTVRTTALATATTAVEDNAASGASPRETGDTRDTRDTRETEETRTLLITVDAEGRISDAR